MVSTTPLSPGHCSTDKTVHVEGHGKSMKRPKKDEKRAAEEGRLRRGLSPECCRGRRQWVAGMS